MEETKVKNGNEAAEKMSYEQLEYVAHQLSEQNKQLYMKLQEVSNTNVFKRLDYLFKVVENSTNFDSSFLNKCISEVVDIMTIPESEKSLEEKQ